MTPAITRFLAVNNPPTPCLVFDVEQALSNLDAIRQALPMAAVYYAVKANPARPLLARLAARGACFDAASIEEVEACLEAGAKPEAISFGNTVKREEAIARAHGLGVRLFAFDSRPELAKIARRAPGSSVYCRLMVGNAGAEWPLSRKFGASPGTAADLMEQARELGLDPCGLSFHVGSQQVVSAAYEAAIAAAADVWGVLESKSLPVRLLNLGGGFPIRYRSGVPSIGSFGDAIGRALERSFGRRVPEILIEPGRYIAGSAGVVRAEVVLVSRRDEADDVRWVYLDIGRFGGLAETEGEAIRYSITASRDGQADGPVAIAGPTCDGADIMYEKADYRMPMDLRDGDVVTIHAAGAYVTTYASQSFNGFVPLAEYYV